MTQLAFQAVAVVNTAERMLGTLGFIHSLTMGLHELGNSGVYDQLNSVYGDKSNRQDIDYTEAMNAFRRDGLKKILKQMARKEKISQISHLVNGGKGVKAIIKLPSAKVKTKPVTIPTGLKFRLKGKKPIPIIAIAGGPATRVFGTGVRLGNGQTHDFFRMDVGPAHRKKGRRDLVNPWSDSTGKYHFHVPRN